MSERTDIVEALADLAGPLGPFTTPAQRRADVTAFLATIGASDVSALAGLLLDAARASDPADPWADQHALLLQEALTVAAEAAGPAAVLDTMTTALGDRVTRGAALDAIGALGVADGVPAILAVLEDTPSEDDLVRAAAALGEIGGDPAETGLHRIRDHAPDSAAVRTEVEAALAALGRGS